MNAPKPSTTSTARTAPSPRPTPTAKAGAISTPGSLPGSLPGSPPSDSTSRYLNRDLSWLEFNRRVLAQALDARTPLLTRVKFLGIFSSNLDEFFQKRIGTLKHLVETGQTTPSPDGLSPRQTLGVLRPVIQELQATQARCYLSEILPALAAHNIELVKYSSLSPEERKWVDRWFMENVFPTLTPLAVDPGHRFPFISNLSENLGVMVAPAGSPTATTDERGGACRGVGGSTTGRMPEPERHFVRVKIPDLLPRLIQLPTNGKPGHVRVVHMEQVIGNNLDDLFPGMTVHETMTFRVTRDAEVEVDDDDHQNLLETVEEELKLRRFAKAVRLEVSTGAPKSIVDFVAASLKLESGDVYEREGPMEYGDLFPIADLPRADLRENKWTPVMPPRLAPEIVQGDADVFAEIRKQDIFLHHPYESFNASVERFIAAAARDPDVVAIKQTIYRTSRDSPFVASLIRAAEEGKQVACLVEVRARFDESKNVRFARLLEKAGVHVAYGVVGYKTHCKTSLVVRREGQALRCYAHLGTGNYNPSTAQLYTDVGLLTSDPNITADLVDLFNHMTGRSLKRDYRELLVAPLSMRDAFMALIDREIELAKAGEQGEIVAKMNALEDLKITEKLYEASRAGVRITLIVRGFCCLRPGVSGMSDHIRVISVIGHFLEHSRIFYFRNGQRDALDGRWYIGSADWMYRNLSARVEAAVPIKDRAARVKLKRILDVMLADHRFAWDLDGQASGGGRYIQREPAPTAEPDSPHAVGTFQTLMWDARGSM
jgi:polyphosphate kinase